MRIAYYSVAAEQDCWSRLLRSVPDVNGVRRATAPYLRRQGRALARHGFAGERLTPYDPARLLRRFLPRGARGAAAPGVANVARQPRARAILTRVLFSPPAAKLLDHLLRADAVKR